jgi:hypothetical protein
MNAEPFILTGAAAGLLVGLTGRLFRPELRTRRAAAMDRAWTGRPFLRSPLGAGESDLNARVVELTTKIATPPNRT